MKRIQFSKLSVRIFVFIFTLLIVPFSAMLWYVKADMEAMLRDEISLKVTQNLARGENEISQLLKRMANISNVFFRDPETIRVFSDERTDYYERDVIFNKVIRDISMQNLYDYIMDDVKITFFDDKNMPHASWSLNYGDYRYLLDQDWVRNSFDSNGFIVWNMAAPGYGRGAAGSQASQVALARSIMDDYRTDKRLGTLLISIDQQKIHDILETYKYSDKDSVFASAQDGTVLFCGNDGPAKETLASIARETGSQERGNKVISVSGRKYLLSYYTVGKMDIMNREALKIFYLTDYQRLARQIGSLVLKINLLCIFFVLTVLLITIFITKKIADPMRVVARRMSEYKVGDRPLMIESGRKDEIGDIYTAFHTMSSDINHLFESLKKEQATKEKYYYESLKSKMNPHFLFNTLTSIRWMAIIRKADNIRESIDALAAILKYSMTSDEETVELSREMEVVESYCHIQNMRFGNSIQMLIDMPEELRRYRIIKFILQPTVENCFKHAFRNEARSGSISIRATLEGGCLLVTIADDGIGFSESVLGGFPAGRLKPSYEEHEPGLGLRIVDQRIRVAYGEAFGIFLSNGDRGGACVEYRLPAIPPAEGKST